MGGLIRDLFEPLASVGSERPTLAIDIGGTKLAAGIVTPTGDVIERWQVPSRPTGAGHAEALFDTLAEMLTAVGPFDRFDRCGIGCGGPMSADGELVSPLNIPAWRDFPLAARVRGLTGLAVGLDNDAKALALAEGWVGGAVGCSNYLAMVVSTGVGGGIVLDGRLLHGGSGNAGHIGHVVVEPEGFELDGHVPGVLEGEASGTAIAAQTGRPAQEATSAEIERVGRLVGRAVGSVVNLLDLERCLVGGSVALGFGRPFFAAAQQEMDRICQLDHSRGRRIEPVGCGDTGPLIGAAAIARFVRCT
jgi:glucokinase